MEFQMGEWNANSLWNHPRQNTTNSMIAAFIDFVRFFSISYLYLIAVIFLRLINQFLLSSRVIHFDFFVCLFVWLIDLDLGMGRSHIIITIIFKITSLSWTYTTLKNTLKINDLEYTILDSLQAVVLSSSNFEFIFLF